MRKLTFAVAIAATATSIILGLMLNRSVAEQRRLESNQAALLGEVTLYKTRSEQSAASVARLELSLSELRHKCSEDAEKIRLLGIRLRRAESYAKSVVESHKSQRIALRDSIILRDTVRDTVWVFRSDSEHTSLRGHIADDTLHYDLHTRDTIYQVVHRVPRKFLFFRFGTKAIHQDVWTSNPNAEIVYTEYIEFEKSKRATKRRKRQ